MRAKNISKLAKDVYAVGVHGRTGRDVDEGTLPAGTLVRRVALSSVVTFEASTDGGQTWHKQRTFGELVFKQEG